MHLGLIGYGSIGRALVGILTSEGFKLSQLTILCRPHKTKEIGDLLAADFRGKTLVTSTTSELIGARPDIVVECAGHQAVRDHGAAILGAGLDTIVVSVGAFTDHALFVRASEAARAGGVRLVLPSGAIGGIDLLSALKLAGIESVSYIGRKPPQAWKGTPAEALLELDALDRSTTFFSGTAREAAELYPKNANVAARLALAGLGFDETQVELIADPKAKGNIHTYNVRSKGADFNITIEGRTNGQNSRTSVTTALSVACEIYGLWSLRAHIGC